MLLLRARTLFLLPQRLKEVKPVLWNLIWAKHGLHLLHTFQQEKYWPAENEIKDRASVDTAALTLHRFYRSTREVSGDHYTADWSNRLSLIQRFQRIYSNTAGHAVGGLIYSTVHIFLFKLYILTWQTNRWLYLIAQVACILRHAKLLQVVFFFTRFMIIFLLLFYSCHSCLEFFDTRWFMPGHSR